MTTKTPLGTVLLAIALALIVAPTTATFSQDKSLRQEREERQTQLLQNAERGGWCSGYFNIDGNAAEVLELRSGYPKQDVRAFIKHLADASKISGQVAIIYALLCEGDNQCLEAVSNAIQRGFDSGKKASNAGDIESIKARFVECRHLFGSSIVPSPSKPAASSTPSTKSGSNSNSNPQTNPAAHSSPPSGSALDEADLRDKATDSARRAREAEKEAQKAAEDAKNVAANAQNISSQAGSSDLASRTTVPMTNGGIYVGQAVNNRREGLGVFTAPTIGRVSGQWRDDRFTGLGTWTGEGSSYAGEWSNGKSSGLGVADFGKVKTIGKHEDWNLRLGVLKLEDESPKKTQLGHFLQGTVIDGPGVEETESGERYEGDFVNGKRNGYALFHGTHGLTQATHWQDGKLMREVSPSPEASASPKPGPKSVEDKIALKPKEPVPPTPENSVDNLIDSILKNRDAQEPNEVTRMVPSAPNLAAVVTASEVQAIRNTLQPCVTAAGIPPRAPLISLRILFDQRGVPRTVEPSDTGRYQTDAVYRSTADAIVQAIKTPRCSPWPLPLERYNSWQSITFNFDPRAY